VIEKILDFVRDDKYIFILYMIVMKIPEGATCQWKGKLFSAWTWEQEQFDGSIKTFE
jgi:hypothetical protein